NGGLCMAASAAYVRTIRDVTRSCLSARPAALQLDIGMLGACRRHFARLALLRPDRSIDLHHQPVRLALGRLVQRAAPSLYGYPFDHFDRAARLRCKRCL